MVDGSTNLTGRRYATRLKCLETGHSHTHGQVPDRQLRRASFGPGLGLALAVRPAGPVEAPGSTARRRRVPRSGMRSTVEAGGTGPDNARRSGPVAVDILPATGAPAAMLTAWPWCWRARQRDTAGTAGGRSAGVPCAAA